MSNKKIATILGLVSMIAFSASFALHSGPAHAKEDFEKCYGISKVGENDGWGRQINPGKYKSESNFDGKAWKFVKTGTCLERGGQLTPFMGLGMPTPPNGDAPAVPPGPTAPTPPTNPNG